MRHTMTIAAREIRERSFVFVAAAIVSLMPFIVSLIHEGRSAGDQKLAIALVGILGAVGLTLGLAIVMGTSLITRDLVDRRLSFYFSKPVSVSSIWFGKLAGAVVTMIAAGAIAFLPTFIVAHDSWRGDVPSAIANPAAALVIAACCLLLVLHALSTVIRSRSPLVALDLALLATSVAIAWQTVRPLLRAGAWILSARIAYAMLAAVPLMIVAAGVWQLDRGRTDVKRSHREFSRFFWVATAIVLVVAAMFALWILSAGVCDLENIDAAANSTGDWVAVSGAARHRADYHPTFLVNTKTGESHRLPGVGTITSGSFARNGKGVIAVYPDLALQARGEIHVIRFSGQYDDVATGVTTSFFSPVVASDDLQRFATYEHGTLSVYDVASKRLLGSVRIGFGSWTQLFFVNNELVRVYAGDQLGATTKPVRRELRIYEFNTRTHKLEQTGTFVATTQSLLARVSADGSTLLVNERNQSHRIMHLLDARTASERAVVEDAAPFWNTPLAGGGFAFVQRGKGNAPSILRVADRRGVVVQEFTLPASGLGIVYEIVPGRIFVVSQLAGVNPNRNSAQWDLYVVDLQRSAVIRTERNASFRASLFQDDPRWQAPNTTGECVIVDPQNVLWRWNALTGAKTRIL